MFPDQTTRIYVDSTIIAGGCDPAYKRWTKLLFENFRTGVYKPLTSDLALAEFSDAPDEVLELLKEFLLLEPEILSVSERADTLAEVYIERKVLEENFYCDLLHVAMATLAEADIIISLDHPNILHFSKVRSLIGINIEFGLKPLQIRCPRLVASNECESGEIDS